MVEHEQEEDEQHLVEELAPPLHQESTGDFSAPMKTVLFGRDLARTDGVLHTRRGCHGILATHANTVEEKRPNVADDPAILSDTPRAHQHDEADEHDRGILNETPTSTKPITKDTNEDLTHDDTADFEIVNSRDPRRVANRTVFRLCLGGCTPAEWEGSGEEGLQVPDGEEDVTFQTKTGTGEDHVAEIVANWGQRVLFGHGPDARQLTPGLGSVDA